MALPGPSWKENDSQRTTSSLETAVLSPPRAILAGRSRAKAANASFEPASEDTSGMIRVRWKVRELSAVWEERRPHEQWWETEVETTEIQEEEFKKLGEVK